MMKLLDACWRMVFLSTILAGMTGCYAPRENTTRRIFSKTVSAPDHLEIYLLIGQSNMAGRAQIIAPDFDTLYGTYLFRGDSIHTWEVAVNPLNKYSTIRRELSVQQLGPGYYFAKNMMQAEPGADIGLVVNARGGTSIDLWAPGKSYFNDAVSRTRQAVQNGTLRAILWHQGESDVKKYREYPEKIVNLINALRMEFNNPNLPFIAGEVAEEKPNRAEFNVMLKETLAKVPFTAVARVTGLTTYDSTHFDTRSMRIIGERYAVETLKLVNSPGNKK
ncbi:MAG: sialate O-acetylesterase [Bacteroidales bacterium]